MTGKLFPNAPGFSRDARTLIEELGERRLTEAATVLRRFLGREVMVSTVFKGERPLGLPADLAADLGDLVDVLPEGAVDRDPETRDRFAAEPRVLSFIRELEGHAPQPLAVLRPDSEAAADEAMEEARAMGFTLAPGPRQLALAPRPFVHVLDAATGEIAIAASAGWPDLEAAAARVGGTGIIGVQDSLTSPLEAAMAGLFGPVRRLPRFGQTWSVRCQLPPGDLGLTERTWLFRDQATAEAVFEHVVRRHAPLFAETFPAIDGAVMAAAGQSRKRRRLRDPRAAALRLVFMGPGPVRRAALLSASWEVERGGGVCHWRRAPFDRELLDALIAAAGAARLERRPNEALPVPGNAILLRRSVAVRGRIERRQVLYYARDLADSLGEAQRALGLIEDAPPAAPVGTPRLEHAGQRVHG